MNDVPSQKRKGIAEKILIDGARSGDAGPLFDHLESIGWDEERPAELVSIIRRSKPLMFERPNPGGEALRDQFLQAVHARLAERSPEAVPDLEAAQVLLQRAEEGYRRILAYRGTLAIAHWPGERVAGGLIALAEHRLADIDERVKEAVKRDGFTVPGRINIGDPGGPPVDPDSALFMVVDTLGGTLMMEAYARGWFDQAGAMNLPALGLVADPDLDDAANDAQLGGWWGRWRYMEETARYLDGSIDLGAPDIPGFEAPEEIDRFLYGRCVQDEYDFIANERYRDRSGIVTYDLLSAAAETLPFRGVEQAVPLPPDGLISEKELTQGHMLSQRLGFDITTDQGRFGGLRLLQWVRGYVALSVWIESRGADRAILSVTTAELMALLDRMAFTAAEAETFLAALSFGKRSRDLYDAPLIRTGENWVIIGPAARHADAAKTVPSLLASLKVPLELKGQAYNDRVLKLLRENGLDAQTTTWNFGKEQEYDYDVLVPWGEFLFLFECKNYRLSNGEPKEVFHFRQDLAAAIVQVQRLHEGLDQHPEILVDIWGPDVLSKTIVPCVLFNEPYARDGDIDGIYVYDYSALSRFFDSPFYHYSRDYRLPDGSKRRVQADILRVWAGDEPAAADLLAQLRDPYQLRVLSAQVACMSVGFGLDHTTGALSDRLIRRRFNEAEMIAAMGVDPAPILAMFERADEVVKALWKDSADAAHSKDASP